MEHRLRAPAKINLTLEVLGDLPGGYHELDSVFATLDVADELRWQDAPDTRLKLSGELRGLPISDGEDNLVLRALRALEDASGRLLPLHIELVKAIPAGGGLGGGSADAAALLYGVNRSHELGLTSEQLQRLAAPLGADVAFGVLGGVARGTGRGDQLRPLPSLPPQPLTLVFPPFPCPTGKVYVAWDAARRRPARGSSQRLVEALEKGGLERVDAFLANDLQPAAVAVQPTLQVLAERLEELGWGPVLLCGSGSTLSCWNAPSERKVEEALQEWDCVALATTLTGEVRS